MRHAPLWLALLALLIYAPGLGGGLVYDDNPFLLDNEWLAHGSFLGAFTTNFWPFPDHNWRSVNYRPLGMVAHLALYRLFGLSPFAFHAASILMHAAASVAVFFLLTGLGFRSAVATAAAALFAVHPLHVESVAWMSQLTEVMAGAGILGALALFVWNRRGLSLLVAAAAMLSKEAALVLPALVFLLAAHESPEKGSWARSSLRASLPYALPVVAWVTARMLLLPQFSWASLRLGNPQNGLLLAEAAAHYLRALFLPWPLAVHYQLPLVGDLWMAAAVAGAWFWLAWRSPLQHGLRLAAGLAALPLLLPLAACPQFDQFVRVQDRYGYVAVAGACLAAALLLARLPWKAFVFAGLLVVTAGALVSVRQLRVWDNNEALWTHTLAVTPASKQASLALGYTLYMEGRFAEASVVYRRALAYYPNDPRLLACLAVVQR